MSSPKSSDPRLLLPEWLRDGESASAPLPSVVRSENADIVEPTRSHESEASIPESVPAVLSVPYSDRLSLDTRLDPGQLISAADLPKWLGGLEPIISDNDTPRQISATSRAATVAIVEPTPVIDEPAPYQGVDIPQSGVVDIETNGWILIGAALGLLVLLLAALKLYLS